MIVNSPASASDAAPAPAFRRRAGALVALLALAAAAPLGAQPPSAPWRTLETPHFRIHYPAAAEAWSRHVAERLEAIREAVGAEVGYTPPESVDVVVADPAADANGAAWALVDAPRMVLWATPPSASSTLGHLSDWSELVAVHEYAHLAHLLRPSRNPLRRWLGRHLVPLAPLATNAPRWAIEGYATLLEGRITGSGRPSSALRAAVISTWARAGRLPGYGALSSDRVSFLGGSMAYLVGSAFLEWVEVRSGDPRALPKLWAAATARAPRSFDAAWTRVFGDSPANDYARFVAETTTSAIERERAEQPLVRAGEVWLGRDGATGEPAISPDGTRLAALLFRHDLPTRLAVWKLDDDTAHADAAASETNADDPEDPPARPRPPQERDRLAELEEPPAVGLLGARFLPDGDSLLVAARFADRDGVLHAELARWRPGGSLARITRGADVRDADPLPDGRSAVAVRWRNGASQLVRVDLARGDVQELTPARVDVVDERPRLSPDGNTLVWLRHRDGAWQLLRAPFVAGALGDPAALEIPERGEPLAFAWRRDASHLYVSVARHGRIAIEALPMRSGASYHRVTRSLGADFDPVPTPDGRELFYLALAPDGLDVRRLDLDATTSQELAGRSAGDDAPTLRRFSAATLEAAHDYGFGRAETRPLVVGWMASPSGPLELGVRLGDVLGRWELVALGAAGGAARHGGALRATLRRLPVDLDLTLAHVELTDGAANVVELGMARHLLLGPSRLAARLGASHARRDADAAGGRTLLFVDTAAGRTLRRGRLELAPGLAAGWTQQSGVAGTRWGRIRLSLAAAAGEARFALAAERREVRRAAGASDLVRLGGVPSSLAPPSLEPGRVDLPALPAATLAGERLDRWRLRAALPGLPADLVAERDRVFGGAEGSVEIRLVGLERRWSLASLPLVGLPGLEARIGLARIEGDRLDGDLRAWLGLRVPFGRGLADGALDSPR